MTTLAKPDANRQVIRVAAVGNLVRMMQLFRRRRAALSLAVATQRLVALDEPLPEATILPTSGPVAETALTLTACPLTELGQFPSLSHTVLPTSTHRAARHEFRPLNIAAKQQQLRSWMSKRQFRP